MLHKAFTSDAVDHCDFLDQYPIARLERETLTCMDQMLTERMGRWEKMLMDLKNGMQACTIDFADGEETLVNTRRPRP